jgi:hypothetical protein
MTENKKLYIKSFLFGMRLGSIFGAILGALTGALAAQTSGTTGGVSIDAYTGMAFGAIFGGILGAFIPDSFRADVASLNILILQVMTQGRFETAMLLSFLLSVVATIVGAWVGGRNLKPREIN